MFKIFDRYIGRQISFTTLSAVLILSVVLVLGNIFKKLIEEMDKYPELGWTFVLEFIANIMPYSLIFTIPWGFLTSILLIFGRLSADNELTALRMSGLSMPRICAPVFLFALVFTGIALWMNVDVAPKSKARIQQIFFQLATENPAAIFVSDEVTNTLPGYVIYLEDRVLVDPEKKDYELKNMQLVRLSEHNRPDFFVQAKEAFIGFDDKRFFVDPKGNFWEITLNENEVTVRDGKVGKDDFREVSEVFETEKIATEYCDRLIEKTVARGYRETGDQGDLFMTLDQAQMEKGAGLGKSDFRKVHMVMPDEATLQISLETLRQKHHKNQPSYLTVSELRDEIEHAKESDELEKKEKKKYLSALKTELHKRYSLSLACLTFCLVGIPLGVTAQRRETSVGFALSLIIGISYFLFMVIAEFFHEDADVFPHLLIWFPNILFMGIGAFLFYRLSRR